MFSGQTLRALPHNIRFYILLFSVLLSVVVVSWLRLHIASDQVFIIRAQQMFGFISLAFLYGALVLSPVAGIAGKRPAIRLWLFARRAIGVSAFYFAVLHAAVAFWGQVGGLDGMALLPERFRWALWLGCAALSILLIMAATSFDRVVRYMTYCRWKWLHRLVYGASILLIIHVWMVGTHVAYAWVQGVLFGLLVLFFGLEAWRTTAGFARRFTEFQRTDYFLTIFICLWLVWSLALACLPAVVSNYHQAHASHSQERP